MEMCGPRHAPALKIWERAQVPILQHSELATGILLTTVKEKSLFFLRALKPRIVQSVAKGYAYCTISWTGPSFNVNFVFLTLRPASREGTHTESNRQLTQDINGALTLESNL
jgi:hypothetical protein